MKEPSKKTKKVAERNPKRNDTASTKSVAAHTVWSNPAFAKKWADAVNPYGDLFHRTLTNPFVFSVALATKERSFPPRYGDGTPQKNWDPDKAFYGAVAKVHACFTRASNFAAFCSSQDQLLREHEQDRLLSGLNILDLGAGEGCIGRLLVASGASFTAVDISNPLQKIGKERNDNARVNGDHFRWVVANLDLGNSRDDEPLAEIVNELGGKAIPDMVCCLALLDHLEHPERLLRAIRLWLCKSSSPDHDCLSRPLAIATLNPEFFLGPRQWPIEGPTEEAEIFMGPANQKVSVWPRCWMNYELMFSQCGYHVLWCYPTHLSQGPEVLCNAFADASGAPAESSAKAVGSSTVVPVMGPFVFWILLPKPLGTLRQMSQVTLPDSCVLSSRSLAEADRQDIHAVNTAREIQLPSGYPIAFAGNLSEGFEVVLDGSAMLVYDSSVMQSFGKGALLGELESGRNFFVRRFPYTVVAGGENGAIFLHIPGSSLAPVITRDPATLGGRLFNLLRDRVATTTWLYHQRPGKGEKVSVCCGTPAITTARLRRCARAIMLLATVEAECRPKGNGLTVCTSLGEISKLAGVKEAKELLNELRLLSALGAIESFVLRGSFRSGEGSPVSQLWQDLVVVAFRSILGIDVEPAEAAFQSVIVPFFSDPSTIEAAVGRSLGRIKLGSGYEDNALLNTFVTYLNHSKGSNSEPSAIVRVLGNVLWLRNRVLRQKLQVIFIRINDMGFLRRVVFDPDTDVSDLLKKRKRLFEVSGAWQLSDFFQQYPTNSWRFRNYCSIILSYLENCWENGYDVGLSSDEYFGNMNPVASFIETYGGNFEQKFRPALNSRR